MEKTLIAVPLFSLAITYVRGADLPVENYSFEAPGTVKQTNWESVPGWSSDSPAADSGVETGQGPMDGTWTGFLWAEDPSVWNLTTNVIVAGEAYRLQLNAKNTGGGSSLRIMLFYDNAGTRVPLATLDATVGSGMDSYTLQFNADDIPAAIGSQIGIEVENIGGGWVAVDHVRLSTFDPSFVWEGGFGSIDVRYSQDVYPAVSGTTNWSDTAWRGERVYAQIVLWAQQGVTNVSYSVTDLDNGQGGVIGSANIKPQFVSYVLTDDGSGGCGAPPADPVLLMPDILDIDSQRDIAVGTAQPVWISIDIPSDTDPGIYQGQVTVSSPGNDPLVLTMNIEVLANTLPPPADWSFHLDLWQNPWSVARYHSVTPWSQEHVDLLIPLLTMLRDAGQKVITTTLVNAPWGGQTYDAYGTMIEWTKHTDGTWSYDYTIFDQYVELCDSIGLDSQVNCYSMAAWGNIYQYYDEASASYQTVTAAPGTAAYTAHWTPFLQDFRSHLQAKGWTDRTKIAMDERAVGEMQAVVNLVKTHAPELEISLAGHYFSALDADIYDWCPWADDVDPAVTSVRAARGQITTFYTMCVTSPDGPNNFVFSPPAEQVWDGWYAAAQNLDGFLRWAYCSWVADPLVDVRHTAFQGGDCFQVCSGARSSIRFERLRDGIEDYEKIAILKGQLSSANLLELENTLSTISYPQPDCTQVIQDARAVLETLSRTVDASDVTPPSPNPMTWAVVPTATGRLSISMTASTASDTNSVQYYFTCTSSGGHDSGWQESATYEDTGLMPGAAHTYTVKARDTSLAQNTTAVSHAASATTGPAILEGLVAHYTMDTADIGGSTLVDVSGIPQYNGAIAGGVSTATGQIGEALIFSADGQYVDIGAAAVPVPWTAAVWVKPTGTQSYATLLNSSATALRLQQWDGTGQVGLTQYGVADHLFNYTAPANTWVHLVFVGTVSGTDLWANGVLIDSLPVSISCPLDTIGNASGGLRAEIDDLAVWGRDLGTAEIGTLHTEGIAGRSFQNVTDRDGDGISDVADPDDDNDGIPDVWESVHSLDPFIDDASGHSDPDRYNNWFEYVSDTDPLDGDSWQAFSIEIDSGTGDPTARFSTSANRLYTVRYRTNLVDGVWQDLDPAFTGTGSEMTVPDPAVGPHRYYRLRIELP
ncbi:MAG: DUF4091 domain-containing protein [Verrucomicrobia bacterium]|nr:DUF4091 domain-containing protein [Verrucomicrobiota bacterium]